MSAFIHHPDLECSRKGDVSAEKETGSGCPFKQEQADECPQALAVRVMLFLSEGGGGLKRLT